MSRAISLLACLTASAVLASSASAGTIANWKEFNAGSNNSDMNTDSPTIGDGTADDAENAWVGGRFGTVATPATVTLAVGETLTVSGGLNLTGGEDGGSILNQLRLGVLNDGGKFAADDKEKWSGGWIVMEDAGWHPGSTTSGFVSTGSKLQPATNTDDGGAFEADSDDDYAWSISVTRDNTTTVDLFASITGGDNAYDRTYTVNDVTTSLFTYTAVGVLFGGSMALDQGQLSNVQFTVVPEPGALALLALGGLVIALRRRRK